MKRQVFLAIIMMASAVFMVYSIWYVQQQYEKERRIVLSNTPGNFLMKTLSVSNVTRIPWTKLISNTSTNTSGTTASTQYTLATHYTLKVSTDTNGGLFDLIQSKSNRTIMRGRVTENTIDELFAPTSHPTPDNSSRNVTADDSACIFPQLDPFHPSALKRFFLSKTLSCSNGLPTLVYRDGDFLTYNTTRAIGYKLDIKNCRLSVLKRQSGNDFKLAKSPTPEIFDTSVKLPRDEEHFKTECFDYNNATVSQGYFSVIREKPNTENRCQINYQRHIKEHSPKETLSVLFVGVDGVSRQNAIRSMNKTKRFIVNDLQAIELLKFNKVGDNTWPNIVPLLTGLDVKELTNKWHSRRLDEIDHLFIWREFQNAGYRNAMIMDRTYITAFHYLKSGWAHPTFDYYNRPVGLKSEKDAELRSKSPQCIGQTPEVSFLLDYWIQLASVFNNTKTKPYFGFTHMNRLTHERSNRISMADELYLEFFKTLKSRRVLNNTLVIFFSDHGTRFGPVRRTFNGILESRTPFAFLIFPDWFKDKYPEAADALRTNQRRLTTMFDLHETLKDLLTFQGRSKKGSKESRGISLFDEIPKDRTCIHAGIPIEFCMCLNMTVIEASSSLSNKLANAMVQNIVKLTQNIREKCEQLILHSVEAVVSVVEKNQEAPIYQIILETHPNKAVYEGVLKYNSFAKTWGVQGLPVRLNLYSGQAECIDSAKLRPFCYCKNSNNTRNTNDDNDDTNVRNGNDVEKGTNYDNVTRNNSFDGSVN